MIDELRFKNALRCQYGQGKKCCDYCPYKNDNGDCDNGKICKDANAYIKVVERVSILLQNETKQLLEKIGNIPPDNEEIVRCKDCQRRGTYDCPVYVGGDGMCSEPDEWFCADGKRKE